MAVFGDTLRQARAHKGVTLKEAEQATRMSRHHLLALEEEQFDDLPPLIYQRGIVRNYAMYLSLDPNKLLSMFETARGASPDDPPLVVPTQQMTIPSHWAPNFAIIAFMVVMSAVVFAWMYSAYFAPDGNPSTPTELIPTLTAPSEGDTIFLPPTATAVPPTPTPSPTVAATEEPQVVATATETSSDDTSVVDDSSNNEADIEDVATEEDPTEAPSGALSVNFVATDYLDSLTIVADGSEVFSGALAAGDSTGYISADHFQVYVSDPTVLQIEKEDGDSFFMGDTYFELP
jgi:cytoskeleton protein RodZ